MKKVLDMGCVIISLILAFFVFIKIDPGIIIKPDNSPVTLIQIASSPQKSYIGSTAGDDIMRLYSVLEYEAATETVYMTAEPQDVIATGIYSLNPWVNPYDVMKIMNTRGRMVRTGRKAPEVTDSKLRAILYYQEYYLIQLPDGNYILAQFNKTYQEKIKNGDAVTLPIGFKKANSSEARKYLKDICERYEVDDTFTLYMIDDEWQEEHERSFLVIKFVIAAVVFFVVAVVLVMLMDRTEKPSKE